MGCSVPGCLDRTRIKKGMCDFHYGRSRRLGDPLAGGPRRSPPRSQAQCSVDGCDKKAVAKSFCPNHLRRLHTYGSPTGGRWEQDGRTTRWHEDRNGYVCRFDRKDKNSGPNGFVYQHREVMAGVLGRTLSGSESVHHKNGNRSDNRPENLELWVKSQPTGQRVQDLLAWAHEIIRLYEHHN